MKSLCLYHHLVAEEFVHYVSVSCELRVSLCRYTPNSSEELMRTNFHGKKIVPIVIMLQQRRLYFRVFVDLKKATFRTE